MKRGNQPGTAIPDRSGNGPRRQIEESLKGFDRAALLVIVVMTFLAAVVALVLSGAQGLFWIVLAPLGAFVAFAIGRMGGSIWARLTAAGYTGALLLGLGLTIAAS